MLFSNVIHWQYEALCGLGHSHGQEVISSTYFGLNLSKIRRKLDAPEKTSKVMPKLGEKLYI